MSNDTTIKLKKNNNKKIRITQTRLDVLDCLNDSVHAHSVQDIVNHLKEKNKKVNVATVYNIIKFLIDEGVVDIYSDYENKNHVYEIVDKNNFHIHIYNTSSSKNTKIPMPKSLEKTIKDLINDHGYDCHNIKIEILAYNKNNKNK